MTSNASAGFDQNRPSTILSANSAAHFIDGFLVSQKGDASEGAILECAPFYQDDPYDYRILFRPNDQHRFEVIATSDEVASDEVASVIDENSGAQDQ